jgi:hypothetical protein
MRNVQLVLGLVLLCFAGAAPAEMYKWVDENGITHYGDRIPPKYAKQQREVLNKEGDTVKVLEHEKTAAELAEDARQAELQRQEEEQARRDLTLLDMYGSEEDLIKTRDEQLEHLDGNIRISEIALQNSEKDYKSRKEREAQLIQQGKPVPENVQRQLRELEASIESSRTALAKRQQERQALAARFERDIVRWRQLRGIAAPAAPDSTADQGANAGVGE